MVDEAVEALCLSGSYGGRSFFFFKQKTAYEMLRSLVGSEMCIRDRAKMDMVDWVNLSGFDFTGQCNAHPDIPCWRSGGPVSYTHLTLPTIYSV